MDFLSSIAPWIGAAVSGNVPGLITLAASKITEALGYEVEPNKTSLIDAVKNSTMEQQIRLKELDNQFKIEMNRLGYDHIEKIMHHEVDNVKDARAMQVAALNQDSWFAKNYVYILATFWSVVSILYVFLITFWPIPEESIRFADTILGFILGTVISTIINFFMGSAISSKHKDDTISNLAK
jgi:hypothetical protein